ncbi:MAG: hypothetical protein ACE5I1_17555 [bacterium]
MAEQILTNKANQKPKFLDQGRHAVPKLWDSDWRIVMLSNRDNFPDRQGLSRPCREFSKYLGIKKTRIRGP